MHWLVLFLILILRMEADEPLLSQIEQLTFASMGFEKAGEAYFSPDARTVLFQAVPQGKRYYQIYSMDLETRIPKLVSTGKGACTCAYFRPDGNKIIFASSHESSELLDDTPLNQVGRYVWDLVPYMNIYEANPDGTQLVALTSGSAYHAECAYSPDGSQIVYASNESGSMNLYIMHADGSHVRQLTHTNHCYNGGPFFSPDGQQIIFRADRETPHHLQLFITDGIEEQQLTFDEAINWAPFWHPSGEWIAYTTSIHGHHNYEIYLLHVATGKTHRITDHAGFDGLPVFSPDGSKLMWTSKRADGACHLFIAHFRLPEGV